MAALANKTFQDSRTVRIATVIAMFYLPANLVTVRIVHFKNLNFPRSTVNDQVLIRSAAVIFQHHIDLVRQFRAEFHLENPPRGLDRGVDDASLVVGTKLLSWWWERYEKEKQYPISVSQGPTN